MLDVSRLSERLGEKVYDLVYKNDPMPILERADPHEFEAISRASRIRAGIYGAGLLVSAIMSDSDNRMVRRVAAVGAVVSVGGAWNNAAKLLVFGHGPNHEQTQRIREAHRATSYEAETDTLAAIQD